MSVFKKFEKIFKKTKKLIDILDNGYTENDNEDFEQKLCEIIELLKELHENQYDYQFSALQLNIILRSKNHLLEIKPMLIGDLSRHSSEKLTEIVHQFSRQMKALEAVVSYTMAKEDEEFDPMYFCEYYEKWIDTKTGEVFEEQDIDQRDVCINALLSGKKEVADKSLNDCIESLGGLTLEFKNKFQTTIEEVDVFADRSEGQEEKEKRIKMAEKEYWTLSEEDAEKLKPKIEKSIACRNKKAGEENKNILLGCNSREVILTMLTAIKTLKAEGATLRASEEFLQFSEKAEVRLTHNPSSNNAGNLVVNSLGRYGRLKKDSQYDPIAVLSLFERVVEKCGKNKFIEIMLQFGPKPSGVTLEFCGLRNTEKDKALYRGLIRALTLVFQAEIWRYQPVELNINTESDEAVRNISFAMGLAESLELLEEDKIELEELFEADAALGLPTGQKILTSYNRVRDKEISLRKMAQENLAKSDFRLIEISRVLPQAALVPSKAIYTEKLSKTFGSALKKLVK